MSDEETVIAGRVAYDVENEEWVMYVEDGFMAMQPVYDKINEALMRQGKKELRVGDEITITVRRNG